MLTNFEDLLIVLSIAVVIVALLRRIHLPPLLGYLIAGAIVGPTGLGLITSQEDLRVVAEFGVVFLLFTIGLDLSLPKLIAMRRALIGLGGMQVILCTLLTLGVGLYVGLDWPAAITVAGALALSSTAVASKLLIEQNELHQSHGKLSLSILLFQDLAAVPFLILIPAMAPSTEASSTHGLAFALFMGCIVFIFMLAAGRWLLRPLFHQIASARSSELFMLTALLVVLISAFLTQKVGLSLALGAFLAGVMLAETEYVHQIESDIEPFRDILLGLFFVWVGMLINPHILIHEWHLIFAIVAALILFKFVIITGLGIVAGASFKAAVRTGLVLAQGGEFGFALLALAYDKSLISPRVSQIVITSIVLSVAISPLLIRNSKKIAKKIALLTKKEKFVQEKEELLPSDQEKHIILCGYGRVGQTLARFLENAALPFLGLDLDPARIKEARLAGEPAYFGDATDEAVLIAAGVEKARLLMIAFDDAKRSLKVLHIIRKINQNLPILVRTKDDRYLEDLQLAGATEVIPDKLESSLMLASHMLMLLGSTARQAQAQVREVKANRYRMLRSFFQGQDDVRHLDAQDKATVSLHAVELTEGAWAINKTLEEFAIEKMPITLASFSRGGYKSYRPAAHTKLKAGDILVIQGTQEELYLAEEKLLQG